MRNVVVWLVVAYLQSIVAYCSSLSHQSHKQEKSDLYGSQHPKENAFIAFVVVDTSSSSLLLFVVNLQQRDITSRKQTMMSIKALRSLQ